MTGCPNILLFNEMHLEGASILLEQCGWIHALLGANVHFNPVFISYLQDLSISI